MSGIRSRTRALAALAAAGLAAGALALVAPASAGEQLPDPLPGSTPIVVSIGDSYISGEAGRWAGNNSAWWSARSDTGADAYLDAGDREAVAGCHRSKSAEVHIGPGVTSVNLACSGATAATDWAGGAFKPGIDFYEMDDGTARRGQALELYRLAKANAARAGGAGGVRMVVLSIGGNDFGFGPVVAQCVQDYLTNWTRCSDRATLRAEFDARHAEIRAQSIRQAVVNVHVAMQRAGYADDSWTLVVQDYPSPVPETGEKMRYAENAGRQTICGAGMFDADLEWANKVPLAVINRTVFDAAARAGYANVRYLDVSGAFVGRRLCERGVDLVGSEGWRAAGAVDRAEWVAQVRLLTKFYEDPYYLQESLHPDYWGQRALQACLLAVWNAGAPVGGTCTRGADGLDADGRPRMVLTQWAAGAVPAPAFPADGYTYPGPPVDDTGPSPTPTVTVTAAPGPQQPGPTVTVTAAPAPAATVTATATATVTAPAVPAPTVTVGANPGPVLRLRAASPAPGVVSVAWDAPAKGPVTGYELRSRTGSGAWTPWSSTSVRAVQAHRPAGARVTVQVRAVNAAGSGPVAQAALTVRAH